MGYEVTANGLGNVIKNTTAGHYLSCWPWKGPLTDSGYARLDHDGSNLRASRYIWTIIHGPVPDGMYVCHTCDNPKCVNPRHLFLGTPQDNEDDKHRKGRQSKGGRHGRAKLTEQEVEAILTATGTANEIAAAFGVSFSLVGLIKSGRVWRDVHTRVGGGVVPLPQAPRRPRLRDDEVEAIRADTRSQAAIAADYGISQSNVSAIKRRKSHTHLP